jgi:sugar O-acyltransferase (sialic acid O-acetyltransferase NeuD family)
VGALTSRPEPAPVRDLVMWGASGHARVLEDFTSALGLRLVALFDNDPRSLSPFPGVPLYHGRAGFLSWRAAHPDCAAAALVAIGGSAGRERLALQRFLEGHGLRAPVAVHPTAYVAASATVGAGSHVLAQSAVCAGARLGAACIVNTRASVDHECELGDGVHVAPGATLAGLVRVGDATLLGPGAVVLPRVAIGAGAIVGAGAVVTRDVPDGVVVYGNPARVVRANPSS